MTLADYYFADPQLTLIPIEHLTPFGMDAVYAGVLCQRRAWDARRVELFNAAFSLYWARSTALASRSRFWAAPRLRHVAVAAGAHAVRPYAQLLNTSAWMLYESDLDPGISHPEFAAYLLVHGDRMAHTGEVTTAALHNAAYWFERTEPECAAFAAAAARAQRPDAAAFQALAAALPWMRRLYDDGLRPAPPGIAVRRIPATGLAVPRIIEEHPPLLVRRWTSVAQDALASFHRAWQTPDPGAVGELCDWLAVRAPALLITGRNERIVWDPEAPQRLGPLRSELRSAGGAAVRDLLADLRVVDRHTRAFRQALVDPNALPAPPAEMDHGGYTYLHRQRRLIAYNLREPGMERLQSPALPYARAMLGARTVHEWAHLAVDAGWVPQTASAADLTAALAGELDAAIAAAPPAARAAATSEAASQSPHATSTGQGLARLLLTRMPDYQANLLAQRFLDLSERETYVRHNIRTLRGLYAPGQVWRMLIRYLSEYQYLAFSAVPDPRSFFLRSTWFDADFFATGILSDARFDTLTAAVARICRTYAVDETRFRAVGNEDRPSRC
jgi:hypothetical protein